MKTFYNRRNALGLGLAALAAPALIKPSWAEDAPVLLELFTSQGCSDCPPADRLAGELKGRPGLHVVSLNVDYWDYLGWRDTLGKAQYTQRQQEYARVRGDNEVYTPQMVINGELHAVGSNRSAIEAAIAAARGTLARRVPLSISVAGGSFSISVGQGDGSGTVWLMGVAAEVKVPIGKGENSGANVTYHNVVRQLVAAGAWEGASKTFTVPRASLLMDDSRTCLAILQRGRVGQVLGLASLTT